MEKLGKYLIENKITIASVESFTVGGFASSIGSVPGISAVYRGSAVTYQTMMKHKLLGIDNELIEQFGVVSKEIAYEMAKAGQNIFEADLCISFTGNSGPWPMEDKPVGLCYMGIAFKNKIEVFELHLSGSREEIKQSAIQKGIKQIKELLQMEDK